MNRGIMDVSSNFGRCDLMIFLLAFCMFVLVVILNNRSMAAYQSGLEVPEK